MVDLVRWNPLGSLVDEFFGDLSPWFGRNRSVFGEEAAFIPRLDVKETEKSFDVTVDLPGMEKKDIEVSLDDGIMTIKGERKVEEKKEQDGYTHYERHYGSFKRCIRVPENLDEAKLQGEYKDGVLKLHAPKKAIEKPEVKKIELK